MDALEAWLQDFNSTIYGSEMREALCRCFDIIRVSINHYNAVIEETESKIKNMGG